MSLRSGIGKSILLENTPIPWQAAHREARALKLLA
jgi:hypothetical protein